MPPSTPPEQPTETELAELSALADGSLPPERRAEVAARVAASAELTRLLRRQRAALAAIRGAAAPAPAALRAWVEVERGRTGAAAPRRLVAGLAVAACAAALAVALVSSSGGPEGPSVAQAAALGARPPASPPPGRYDGEPALLARAVEGVRFPRWEGSFGWRADGARTDSLRGRGATTVFYSRRGRRIAYTIVAGPALHPPGRAPATSRGGTELRTLRIGDRLMVTWRRKGRTCVLSGVRVSRPELLALASWRAGGRVDY
jgi:anti-sigma factor RsiW